MLGPSVGDTGEVVYERDKNFRKFKTYKHAVERCIKLDSAICEVNTCWGLVWGDTGETIYERGKNFRTICHSIVLTILGIINLIHFTPLFVFILSRYHIIL